MALRIQEKHRFYAILFLDLTTHFIPILGLLFMDWAVFSVMVLYWVDMLVYFVIFMNWFLFVSRASWKAKLLGFLGKPFIFIFFVVIQAYFIFVFTGKYYFPPESTEYDIQSLNITHLNPIDIFQEVIQYIQLMIPKMLEETPFILGAIIIFIVNHLIVLASPDKEAMLEGFWRFVRNLASPTFVVLVVSSINLVALILNKVTILTTISIWTTIFFIVINNITDVQKVLKKRQKTVEMRKYGTVAED